MQARQDTAVKISPRAFGVNPDILHGGAPFLLLVVAPPWVRELKRIAMVPSIFWPS